MVPRTTARRNSKCFFCKGASVRLVRDLAFQWNQLVGLAPAANALELWARKLVESGAIHKAANRGVFFGIIWATLGASQPLARHRRSRCIIALPHHIANPSINHHTQARSISNAHFSSVPPVYDGSTCAVETRPYIRPTCFRPTEPPAQLRRRRKVPRTLKSSDLGAVVKLFVCDNEVGEIFP